MKTEVHTNADTRVHLSHALLVYEDRETAFVTVHAAQVKNGRAHIGPGTPASRPALAELGRKLLNATAIAGFIPEQLLYMSPKAIAWWRPAADARVFFQQTPQPRPGAQHLGTRSAVTPQPDLVFAITAHDWYVWAIDTAGRRPAADTPLCRSPYFNVWQDGRVCTGNVKLPDAMTPEVLGDYERAFFGSNFTHPNDPQGLTRHKEGAYAMWRELLDGKQHAAFPSRWLAPITALHGTRPASEIGKRSTKDALRVTLAAAIRNLEDTGAR